MKTIMILGASRGIGLEITKRYCQQGAKVIATARDITKAAALNQLAEQHNNLSVFPLDISEEEQVKKLAQTITGPIDILIINAGAHSSERSLSETTAGEMLRLFKTNALGHFLAAKYFVNHVANSELKQIISFSSRMGSISDNTSGAAYTYRASKAADNAIMRSVALDTKDLGIHVMVYHPGWVKTDMTNHTGELTIAQAVERFIDRVEHARDYESGLFVSHDKGVFEW